MQELYRAAREGNSEGLRSAVEANPSLAVFAAAIAGDAIALESLVSGNRGLLSSTSPDGWTALHLAAHFDKPQAVRVLLNKGATVNTRSSNALMNTPLHAACAGNSTEAARLLIERGADVNARQHSGWTPLHAAAQNGNAEMARLLIDNGADVNVRADNQQRPLDLALTQGRQGMVEFLEERGARL